MHPSEIQDFLNGAADDNIRMQAAWQLILTSRGCDTAATDMVMIEHAATVGGPTAFFRIGVVLSYDVEQGTWGTDTSGTWQSHDGCLRATHDPEMLAWHITSADS